MKRKRSSRRKRWPARRQRRRTWQAESSHYQVAAPVLAGAKALPQHRVPPRLVSAALLILAGWLIYWFANSDLFYIDRVRIEGHWRLSESELVAVSGLEAVNVFWADTRAAERSIEALPDVASARVRCRLPADCVIQLAERPARLVWRQGEAQVWIGVDGVAVPARGELPNAVVLDAVGSTALKPGDRLDPTLVAAVEELEQLQPEVRVYQYSDEYGLSFKSAYGWLVRLGDGNDMAVKLNLLRTLQDHFSREGIAPTLVDLRFPEAPYYKE